MSDQRGRVLAALEDVSAALRLRSCAATTISATDNPSLAAIADQV
jgi:hypothetical protein